MSLPALARLAEKHVRRYGATGVDDLVDQLGPEAGTREDAEAAVRLAVIAGRLELDRGATLRISNVPDSGLFEREATVDPASQAPSPQRARKVGP